MVHFKDWTDTYFVISTPCQYETPTPPFPMVHYSRGCHVIGKGDLSKAMLIAPLILEKGLLVSNAPWGTAAWAFHIDMVPGDKRNMPLVVFEVDSDYL